VAGILIDTKYGVIAITANALGVRPPPPGTNRIGALQPGQEELRF